jgi:hypothetical protein
MIKLGGVTVNTYDHNGQSRVRINNMTGQAVDGHDCLDLSWDEWVALCEWVVSAGPDPPVPR